MTRPGAQLSLSDAAGTLEEVRGASLRVLCVITLFYRARALTSEDTLMEIGLHSSVIAACSCPEFRAARQPVPLRSDPIVTLMQSPGPLL